MTQAELFLMRQLSLSSYQSWQWWFVVIINYTTGSKSMLLGNGGSWTDMMDGCNPNYSSLRSGFKNMTRPFKNVVCALKCVICGANGYCQVRFRWDLWVVAVGFKVQKAFETAGSVFLACRCLIEMRCGLKGMRSRTMGQGRVSANTFAMHCACPKGGCFSDLI